MFTNTAADPTALEQVTLMINRYNQLVSDINALEDIQNKKEAEITALKSAMQDEISELKTNLSELKKKIELATKMKVNVGREFKQIVKIDSFNRLSRRIDSLNFEKRLSRAELYRMVDKKIIQ